MRQPWGTTIALLTASVVTIVGVLKGLDPEVIVLRVGVAATCTGVVACIVGSLIARLVR